jgi:hypothetical protein
MIRRRVLEERFWAIRGRWEDGTGAPFFYTGTYFTRASAIRDHIAMKGRTWRYWYRRGDRCVPVIVREVVR